MISAVNTSIDVLEVKSHTEIIQSADIIFYETYRACLISDIHRLSQSLSEVQRRIKELQLREEKAKELRSWGK